MSAPRTRIPAAERREQILDVAADLFGSNGFTATTTDQVARAAGISQPYVIRVFGSKDELVRATVARAGDRVMAAFRAVVDEADGISGDELAHRLGEAYVDLIADRGLLRVLMQAFLAGADPAVGPTARHCFLKIAGFMRDAAGMSADQVVGFLAHGMLLNTLLGLDLPAATDSGTPDDTLAAWLVQCALGHKADLLLRQSP
ncbi:TetR/AcrR family transcriptional regulator [Nakamurella leprariae]|uniref:TetR/AcrR family transcriptional regulator n=1 Tax=Nakamurella leprariae TaxID=2803911 RepID=A0A939C0I8_9ACTN|nr:TetR/AcrR family transcriptional regulator [Nakamurella leprariae]MBM9468806.1 TetR/AcrR family transcriptional regulator [Nakamurella leprariae]